MQNAQKRLGMAANCTTNDTSFVGFFCAILRVAVLKKAIFCAVFLRLQGGFMSLKEEDEGEKGPKKCLFCEREILRSVSCPQMAIVQNHQKQISAIDLF